MIAISDMHLARHIWPGRPSIYGDAYAPLRALADSPPGKEPIIMAGDIFDTATPDGDSLWEFHRFCSAMEKAGCPMYAVQGNHDRSSTPLFASFGVRRLSLAPVSIDGLRVCGLDWMPSERLLRALADVPPCDLLVMHAPFRHMLGYEGKWQLELKDIPAHVGSVIAGDIHVFGTSSVPSGGLFLSPGATRPRNMDDLDGGFGWVELDVAGGRLAVRNRRKFEGRKFIVVEDAAGLTGALQLACEAAATAREELPPVLLVPPDCVEAAGKPAGVLVSIRNKTREITVERQADPAGSCSLLDQLGALVKQEEEPELHSLLDSLLRAPDELVDRLVKEWLVGKGVIESI